MASTDHCMYQSSSCPYPRAFKDNGERHRLCEYHRDKANETQRLWHSRHKHRKRRAPSQRQEPYKRRSCAHLKTLATATSSTDEGGDSVSSANTTPTVGDGLGFATTDTMTDSLPWIERVSSSSGERARLLLEDEEEEELDGLLTLIVEYTLAASDPHSRGIIRELESIQNL